MDFEEHNLCVYRNPTPPSLVIRVAKPERSAVVAVVANLPPVATYKLQCSLCQQLQSGLERATSHNQWVAVVSNVLRVTTTNESQWSRTLYESQPMSRSGLKHSTSHNQWVAVVSNVPQVVNPPVAVVSWMCDSQTKSYISTSEDDGVR